jgi:hypothetical protein
LVDDSGRVRFPDWGWLGLILGATSTQQPLESRPDSLIADEPGSNSDDREQHDPSWPPRLRLRLRLTHRSEELTCCRHRGGHTAPQFAVLDGLMSVLAASALIGGLCRVDGLAGRGLHILVIEQLLSVASNSCCAVTHGHAVFLSVDGAICV